MVGWCVVVGVLGVSFVGYVLPLSSMSYWGLTVFSNVVTTVPVVGEWLCVWLWGSEFVSDFTVRRCLVGHVFVPGLVVGGVCFHVWVLHVWVGSDGVWDRGGLSCEKVWFGWWFGVRDVVVVWVVMVVWCLIGVCCWWWWLHEEMWIPVSVVVTSEKVVPEWFVVSFFGLLKSIPVKGVGFVVVVGWFGVVVVWFMCVVVWGCVVRCVVFVWVCVVWGGVVWVSVGVCGGVVVLVFPVVLVLQVCVVCLWVVWVVRVF